MRGVHLYIDRVPQRILVVEDDLCLQSDMIEICKRINHEMAVECVTSAEAGSRLLHHGNLFDLVLCDISLPGGRTGIDLWQDCRARYPKLRFVFMSSISSEEFNQRISVFPRPVFLQKPFTVSAADHAIREALS